MPYPTAGAQTPHDGRSLLVRLLHDALITIRIKTRRGSTEADHVLAYALADWTHNWPNWLDAAESESDHEDIWNAACSDCPSVVREWVQLALRSYGVRPQELGLSPAPWT